MPFTGGYLGSPMDCPVNVVSVRNEKRRRRHSNGKDTKHNTAMKNMSIFGIGCAKCVCVRESISKVV